MSFTVLGIVTTVISLMDSLGGAKPKLSNKRSIPLWKNHDIFVSFTTAEMVRKWQNMQKISMPQQRR